MSKKNTENDVQNFVGIHLISKRVNKGKRLKRLFLFFLKSIWNRLKSILEGTIHTNHFAILFFN